VPQADLRWDDQLRAHRCGLRLRTGDQQPSDHPKFSNGLEGQRRDGSELPVLRQEQRRKAGDYIRKTRKDHQEAQGPRSEARFNDESSERK
jgi:hypothetical protein